MPDNCPKIVTGHRLTSLDALRGFTMLWIIGGDKVVRELAKVWENPATEILARHMKHAGWDDFLFLDLIAPPKKDILQSVIGYKNYLFTPPKER